MPSRAFTTSFRTRGDPREGGQPEFRTTERAVWSARLEDSSREKSPLQWACFIDAWSNLCLLGWLSIAVPRSNSPFVTPSGSALLRILTPFAKSLSTRYIGRFHIANAEHSGSTVEDPGRELISSREDAQARYETVRSSFRPPSHRRSGRVARPNRLGWRSNG